MKDRNEYQPSLFRQQLLAQLALRRAVLLKSMLGVDDEGVNRPIWDTYSIRHILPHIARWDGFEAQRLSLLRDGRLSDIHRVEPNERNLQWRQLYADMTLEAGVAMLLKERNGLLNVLESVPDQLLKATVTLSADFQLPVLRCVTNSIEHDQAHTQDIMAWRVENGLQEDLNGSPAILLAAMKTARQAVQAMVALITSAENNSKPPTAITVDGWNVNSLLAHLAGWEKIILTTLQSGQRTRPEGHVDQLNAAFETIATTKSRRALWEDYQAVRRSAEKIVATSNQHYLHTPILRHYSPYLFACHHTAHDSEHLEEFYTAYLIHTRTRK